MDRNLRSLSVTVILLSLSVSAFSCNTGTQPSSSKVEGVKTEVFDGLSVDSENPGNNVTTQYEWPCFHGADRTNKSPETGLLKSWPDGGPDLLLNISGLGEGYASVAIADDMIFTSGTFDDQTYVFAYDMEGNLVWKKPNGSAWEVEVYWAVGYDGPRSTPTYDDGVVFHLSELNKLTAYDAKTGYVVWSRDLMRDFETDMPDYGFTESVLVEGDKLFVKPAGAKGFQVCLNKTNGETIWVNNDIPGLYGYNSPVLYDSGDYRQLISASSSCYYGVDTETGKLLWKTDFENSFEVNCTDPIVIDDYVFMSSGESGGCKLIKLIYSGNDIITETVWETDLMDNYHGGIIYHDGYFYGSGDKKRGWFAIDMRTGKQMWRSSGSMGSLTYADGMLYLYDEKGTMSLVKASPDNFEVIGEFKLPVKGSGPYWAHPVVCEGRLYLRYADNLLVYDISN